MEKKFELGQKIYRLEDNKVSWRRIIRIVSYFEETFSDFDRGDKNTSEMRYRYYACSFNPAEPYELIKSKEWFTSWEELIESLKIKE